MADIDNVIVGNFGTKIVLTMQDLSGTVVDVSTYIGTNTVTFRKPDSSGTQSFTLAFNTDGVDGKVKFTPTSGDIDTVGDWNGTIEFKIGATVVARSTPFTMEVLKSYVP